MGYLRDFVDFIDNLRGLQNKSRLPLSAWWVNFVGGYEKIGKPDRTIGYVSTLEQKTRRHLDRMLPSMCVARHGLGVSIDELADELLEQLKEKDKAKIDQLRGYGYTRSD